jgi:myo-inositol-1(or 4)-monophosphatase
VAAGSLMVQEAGGIVNDINKFNNNSIDIRASNDGINDKMIRELQNF